MSQPSLIDIDLDDADPNGIFLIASIAGAQVVVLDGALVTGTTATMDFARRISIISAGNDAGITFTTVGTDADGKALTEVITGGNVATVESTGYFKTITSITTSGASAGNVTIGTVDEAVSNTFPLNHHSDVAPNADAVVTGTVDYTLEQRFDSVYGSTSMQSGWQDITAFADKTATVTSTITRGATATRLVINSHSSGARVQLNIAERVASL